MEEGTGGGAGSHTIHSGRAKTRSADGGGDWRRGRLTSYAQWKGQDKVRRWRRGLEEGQTHILHTVEGPRQGQQMEEETGGGADSHAMHSCRAKTRSADGGLQERQTHCLMHSGRAKTRLADGGVDCRRGRLTGCAGRPEKLSAVGMKDHGTYHLYKIRSADICVLFQTFD